MAKTKNDLLSKLQGFKDARGSMGILSRGKNIYKGASTTAQSGGGPQYGRPAEANLAKQRAATAKTIPSQQAAQDPRQNVIAAKEALMRRFADQNKEKQLGQQQDVTSAIQAQRQAQPMEQGNQLAQRTGDKADADLRKRKIMEALQQRRG